MNCDVNLKVFVSNGLQDQTFALEEGGGRCLVQVVCLTLILGCEVLVLGFQEGTPYSNIQGALPMIFFFPNQSRFHIFGSEMSDLSFL